MPTYEYLCDSCGHRFELFQQISAPPRRRCPECRGKVRRLIGAGAGLLFKGSGFYITDYRSQSYRKAAKAEQTAGSSKSGGEKSSGATDVSSASSASTSG